MKLIEKITRMTLIGSLMGSFITFPAKKAMAEDKIIKIDGSSTVYPITEAVAEEYQANNKGAVKVTVGISGTGGGFKKFCRGETEISDASRPIKYSEMKACRDEGIQYIELPVAFDALTVVVNLQNTWAETITVAELKKMWEPAAQGKVKKWKDVNSAWPDEKLSLFGPGSDSGTFDYFTEAVNGKAAASRGDYTASEDDNVLVQGVVNDKGGLGYFGFAYFEENQAKLKAAKIDGGKGAVLPSRETVEKGTYAPLSRPIFIYVNKKAAKSPEIMDFVKFYITNAQELVAQVGYIPLGEKSYQQVMERFNKMEVGSAFGGQAQIGVSIDEVLNRKPKI